MTSLPQAGLPQAGLPQAGLPQAGLPQADLPQADLSRKTDLSQGDIIWARPDNEADILAAGPWIWRFLVRVLNQVAYGAIVFRLPDGRRYGFDSGTASQQRAHLDIHDYAFIRKTLLGGTIGFYESFENGDWSTPNLAECLFVFAKNTDVMHSAFLAHPLLKFFNNFSHRLRHNSKTGSKRNIMAHYDLGNAFYETWLDPGMTYSSALFQDGEVSLEQAQTRKYQSLAQKINLSEQDEVLEIGCGWGGFAEIAAKEYGARVTGITLSEEQHAYAQARIFRQGLAEKVKFQLRDYRDVAEKYSKIVSIEMFEAVGERYWPVYFDKIKSTLQPNGIAGLQIITIADRFFDSYRKSSDFIQKYVFPGGMLPSPKRLEIAYANAGLKPIETHSFGADYAETLARWHRKFLSSWQDIQGLPKRNDQKSTFDERFKKLWQFYLAYCEAGFRAGSTDVRQVTLARI